MRLVRCLDIVFEASYETMSLDDIILVLTFLILGFKGNSVKANFKHNILYRLKLERSE